MKSSEALAQIITSLPKVIREEGRVAAKVCHGAVFMTTAKVVAGEFITPHQLLPTLWAKPAHIAKARCSPVLKINVAASGAA